MGKQSSSPPTAGTGTRQLRGLIEAAPDGIVVVDREGRVVHANAQMEKLFGYPREELVGLSHDTLVPPRFRNAHSSHRVRYGQDPVVRPMGVPAGAVFGLRKDGTEFPAEISLSPLETSDGTLFVAFIRDASESVALRQRERAAREEAERAARLRDEFLAMVAHDLRNPLNGINLRTSLLLRKSAVAADDELREQLEQIKSLVRRMNALIKDLLDMAAIDSGQLRIVRDGHEPARIVRGAVDAVAPLCGEKRLLIATSVPDGGPPVFCDLDRVQQALGNLLSNAIKFSPEGGTIVVEAARLGREVRFSVADSGPGIADGAREHVFDRYWRGGERDVAGGVGLGLFITKGIVESHGGRIWVESDPGRGSTFFFTLQAA
ncbi:MAG TPA: PAS domain-containing sensor histidine kinase [Polyangiaceae bacterium]|nr:PAS domain-containing sensor histidine kinase [Polyangiaceae bacterium]